MLTNKSHRNHITDLVRTPGVKPGMKSVSYVCHGKVGLEMTVSRAVHLRSVAWFLPVLCTVGRGVD